MILVTFRVIGVEAQLRLTPQNKAKRLVFICWENPGQSGISLFPERPRFCKLMKTLNRGHPRLSGMVGDKSGK